MRKRAKGCAHPFSWATRTMRLLRVRPYSHANRRKQNRPICCPRRRPTLPGLVLFLLPATASLLSLPTPTADGRAQVESDQLKSTDYKGPPSAIAITRPIRGLPGQCCHFLFCGKVPGETGRSGKTGSEIRHLNKTSERKQTIHLTRRLRRSASERERLQCLHRRGTGTHSDRVLDAHESINIFIGYKPSKSH